MNYQLRPSDLTFLYEGCKRCFYLRTRNIISRPFVMPAIFTKIAGLLKNYYDGKHTKELHKDLPPGVVKYGEKNIESQNIRFSEHKDTCFIKGRFDIATEFDDGTYGIFDFKTSDPKQENTKLYSHQLHAYAYALENPAYGTFDLSPISMLGLIYTPPLKISQENIDWVSFDSKIHLVKIEKDYQAFQNFIKEILILLETSDFPESSPDCDWCNYIRKIDKIREL